MDFTSMMGYGGYDPVSKFTSGNVNTGGNYNWQNNNQLTGGAGPGMGNFMQSLSRFLPEGFLSSTAADGTKTQGWGGLAIDGLGALGSGWMAMQNYGLAKDSFKEGKRQFNKNFDAQAKLTNSQLRDRQSRRVSENSNAMGVDKYMMNYGI